jgi:hypothetical protein
MNRLLMAASVASVVGLSTAAKAQQYIWWEAEQPMLGNFPATSPFAPENAEQAAKLSGKKWITAGGKRKAPLFLQYKIAVPKDGEYRLYTRKFWKHGPFKWRFNDGEWQNVGKDVALLDNVDLRTHLCANWTFTGKVTLKAGDHFFRIELTENDGAAGFDAFVLTSVPFTPRGTMKPDEKYNTAPEGWFAYEPDADVPNSPIDLRYLNEKVAGENGFIVARDNKFFHSSTNQPVRFWGVNAGPNLWDMDDAAVDNLCAMLARRGVNLVRLHGKVFHDAGPNKGKPDAKAIARLRYFVAAAKKQGMYTTLSFYFPLWIKLNEKDGFPGYKADSNPFGILFWDEKFQAMHREWLRAMLTTADATGPALKDEPAVLSIEIQNEDSLFFWTFNPYDRIPGAMIASLEQTFGDWLTNKYGSIDAALTAWNSDTQKGDNPAAGRVGLGPVWRMFNVRDARSQDVVTFLTILQSKFYRDTTKFIREEIGAKSLVSGTNWTTASPKYLEPLERYANTYADFIDRHGYYNGAHEGERAGWSISAGDKYNDRSIIRAETLSRTPGKDTYTPIQDISFNDQPTMVSEIDWTEPNRFRTEMPLFLATYAALTDVDAIGNFCVTGPGHASTLSKFSLQSPVSWDQYPAAALMYRQGLIDTAPVVASVNLNVEKLKQLNGWPINTRTNLDTLRAADIPAGQLADSGEGVDGRSSYVGRVQVTFSDQPDSVKLAGLDKFIREGEGKILSATGQVEWNYGKGVLKVDAPKAQAVTGDLSKNSPVKLSLMTVDSPLDNIAVMLVPLDGQPLATSKKMLLQVMSEQTNFDWQASDADAKALKTITRLGKPPLIVKQLSGSVAIARDGLRVTKLASNGAFQGEPVPLGKPLQLDPKTIYYLIDAP